MLLRNIEVKIIRNAQKREILAPSLPTLIPLPSIFLRPELGYFLFIFPSASCMDLNLCSAPPPSSAHQVYCFLIPCQFGRRYTLSCCIS